MRIDLLVVFVSVIWSTPLQTAVGPYELSVAASPTGSVLVVKHGLTTVSYPLSVRLTSIDQASKSPAGRLVAIGRGDGDEFVVVIQPDSQRVLGMSRAGSVSVSADGRFVMWARHLAPNAMISAEYYAANVDELPLPAADGTAGIAGRLLYPDANSGLHVRGSDIVRVADSIFAFLDFSPQARTTRVIGITLSEAGSPTIVAQPLKPTDFLDAPPAAVSLTPGAPSIVRVDGDGLVLQIDLAPASPASPGRSARVRMW